MKNNEVTLKLPTDFVEAIIAKSCDQGLANAIMHSGADLSIILKGVLGFMHKPKFGIGEHAICNRTIWDYCSQESKEKDESKSREVSSCTVIGHNPYSNIYYIEYTWFGKSSNQVRYMDVEESDLEHITPMDM
jgi:hypothetical protein